MKTLQELCDELIQNEELKKEFIESVQNNKVESFLTAHDYSITTEEIINAFNVQGDLDKTLSLEELKEVTGGSSPNAKKVMNWIVDLIQNRN